jgi:hypothetical protein
MPREWGNCETSGERSAPTKACDVWAVEPDAAGYGAMEEWGHISALR